MAITGIITVGLAVEPLRKRARWAGVMALGETVDVVLTGVTGTDAASLVLTLRDPAPPRAPRGEATPAAGHAVAACAVWTATADGLHGILDLRLPEMVRAFREQPRQRALEFTLGCIGHGELLASGSVAVRWNPNYAGSGAGLGLSTGQTRDFVTGGDAHAHDGEATARVSHHHLLDRGSLTHDQIEAAVSAAAGAANAATNAAAAAGAMAGTARDVAEGAADVAESAEVNALTAMEDAAAAGVAAAGAVGRVHSLEGVFEAKAAADTAMHAGINQRLGVIETALSPETQARIAALEETAATLQALCVKLLWRSTRVPDATGTQWAGILAVETAGRVALGSLGSLVDEPN